MSDDTGSEAVKFDDETIQIEQGTKRALECYFDDYPKYASLLASSNSFIAVGTNQGFNFGPKMLFDQYIENAEEQRPSDLNAIAVEETVYQVRFTFDEKKVIAAAKNGTLNIFEVEHLTKNITAPSSYKIPLQGEIIDVRPNPEQDCNLVAVLLKQGECHLINLESKETTVVLCNDATAICWSRKGKQIVCGKKDGNLVCYDLVGNDKGMLNPPKDANDHHVHNVLWVENHVFFVFYQGNDDSNNRINKRPWIIKRKPDKTVDYNSLFNVCVTADDPPDWSDDEDDDADDDDDENNDVAAETQPDTVHYFSTELLQGIGGLKHIVLVANSGCDHMDLVGETSTDSWIDYNGDGAFLTITHKSYDEENEVYPVGLAISLSTETNNTEETENRQMLCLYHLTNEGILFRTQYSATKTKVDAPASTEPAHKPSFVSTPASSTTPTGTSNLFGLKPPTESISFAQLARQGTSISNPPPGISSSTSFGSATSTPSNTSAFGTTSSLGAATPAFGSTSSLGSGSTFGSTSAVGASSSFGSSAGTSMFGPSATPAFGSTTPFGAASSPISEPQPKPPAFGSATPFGAPSLPTSQSQPKPPAFGSATSFGASFSPTSEQQPKTSTSGTPTQPTIGANSSTSLQSATGTAFSTTATQAGAKFTFSTGTEKSAPPNESVNNIVPQTKTTDKSSPSMSSAPIIATKPTESPGSSGITNQAGDKDNAVQDTVLSKQSPKTSSPRQDLEEKHVKWAEILEDHAPAPEETEEFEPTAEPGIGRAFEKICFEAQKDLKELSKIQQELELSIQKQNQNTSSKQSGNGGDELESSPMLQAHDFAPLIRKQCAIVAKYDPIVSRISETIDNLQKNSEENEQKTSVIKELANELGNVDKDDIVQIGRQLDDETEEHWNTIKSKTEKADSLLLDLRNRMQQLKKLAKVRRNPKRSLSVFELNSLIQDVKLKATNKAADLTNIEERLTMLQLQESNSECPGHDGSQSRPPVKFEPFTKAQEQFATRFLQREFLAAVVSEMTTPRAQSTSWKA